MNDVHRTKSDGFMLRFPDGMREQIREAAETNERSMNAEIIARLSGAQATLRDQFAMAALTGLIPAYQAAYGSPTSECMELVQEAYGYADIMLATRESQP